MIADDTTGLAFNEFLGASFHVFRFHSLAPTMGGVFSKGSPYVTDFSLVGTRSTSSEAPRTTYDYIVIGGGMSLSSLFTDNHSFYLLSLGTAGCVLAARLSEDPNVTVLLLEAGGSALKLRVRSASPNY